jgi:hypothetical protein
MYLRQPEPEQMISCGFAGTVTILPKPSVITVVAYDVPVTDGVAAGDGAVVLVHPQFTTNARTRDNVKIIQKIPVFFIRFFRILKLGVNKL